jgi:hypothetical protein
MNNRQSAKEYRRFGAGTPKGAGLFFGNSSNRAAVDCFLYVAAFAILGNNL